MVSIAVPGKGETGGEPKRGPGRPKGSSSTSGSGPKKSQTGESISDLLRQAIMGGSAVIASKTGHIHWLVTEEEAQTIADPLGRIIDKLMPNLEKYGDAALLAMALLSVAGPRVMREVAINKAEAARKEAQSRGAGSAGTANSGAPAHTGGGSSGTAPAGGGSAPGAGGADSGTLKDKLAGFTI